MMPFRFNSLKLARTFLQILSRHKHGKGLEDITCVTKPQPLIDLNCKVVLIAGGTGAIGLATAHKVLEERAQHVALIGNDNCKGREAVTQLNCAHGKGKAVFFNCDVQCKAKVIECYDKVIKEFGDLDVVINAAGVFDEQQWEKEVMTNFVGTIHNMLQAYHYMDAQESGGGGGVILNFSGLQGVAPPCSTPILAANFHAILGLSRSFGHENNCTKTRVRVVTLCPGFTNTEFMADAEKRALNAMMADHIETELCKGNMQNASVCAVSAIHALKFGVSGSVWVVDGSKLYSLNIPDWEEYRVLESQLM